MAIVASAKKCHTNEKSISEGVIWVVVVEARWCCMEGVEVAFAKSTTQTKAEKL